MKILRNDKNDIIGERLPDLDIGTTFKELKTNSYITQLDNAFNKIIVSLIVVTMLLSIVIAKMTGVF